MMLASPKEIGLRLYKLRAERGQSGHWVAARLRVSSVSYYRWEAGTRLPCLEYAFRMAELYKLSIEELFGTGPESR